MGASVCIDGVCEPTDVAEGGSSAEASGSSEDGTSAGPDSGPGGAPTSSADETTSPGVDAATDPGSESESDPEESGLEAGSSTTGDPTPVVILPNGDFEQGTSGWTPFGPTTLSIDTTQSHGGLHSVLVSDRTADWNGILATITGRVEEQVNYAISGWVRLSGEDLEAVTRLSYKLTCSGIEPSYNNIVSTTVSTQDWTELTGVFVIPGGCAPNEVSIYFEGARVGTDPDYTYLDFYVDDVSVEPID